MATPAQTSPGFLANGFSAQPSDQQPISIKCILLGDSGVGKTSLVVSYTTNDYRSQHVPTALDTFYVEVHADNRPVQLQICDSGGSIEASSLRHLSYPGVHVILLCFSVVQPASFRSLRDRWVTELSESCLVMNPSIERLATVESNLQKRIGPLKTIKKEKIKSNSFSRQPRSMTRSPTLLLVGCACDLRHDIGRLLELSKAGEEPVDKETAEQLAAELGAEAYIECSALTQKNLKTVFDLAVWCGLGVVNSGGPAHRLESVSNGHGSLPSLTLSNRSSQTLNHNASSLVNPAQQSQSNPHHRSTLSSKSNKSLWRKLLCMP